MSCEITDVVNRPSHWPQGLSKVASLELHFQHDPYDVSEVTGVFEVPEASQTSSKLTSVERDTVIPLTRHFKGREGVQNRGGGMKVPEST